MDLCIKRYLSDQQMPPKKKFHCEETLPLSSDIVLTPDMDILVDARHPIGTGTYGSIYKTSHPKVALKSVELDGLNCKRRAQLAQAEAVIALFLAKNIADRHCPNFCSAFAYRIGDIGVSPREGLVREYPEENSLLMFIQRGVYDAWKFFAVCASVDDEAGMFSIILQTLSAIHTMDAIGIRHNDCKLTNVVVRNCSKECVIRYQLGQGTSVSIKTNGFLAMLTDFGLSTTDLWVESYDGEEPKLNCDPRIAHAKQSEGSLTGYYIDDNLVHNSAPRGLLLPWDEKTNGVRHQLSYTKIPSHLRDIVYLMSDVYWWCEKFRQTKSPSMLHVQSFAKEVLALATSKTTLGDVVREAMSRNFVSRFASEPEKIFAPEERRRGVVTAIAPGETERQSLSQKLCGLLESNPVLNKFIT